MSSIESMSKLKQNHGQKAANVLNGKSRPWFWAVCVSLDCLIGICWFSFVCFPIWDMLSVNETMWKAEVSHRYMGNSESCVIFTLIHYSTTQLLNKLKIFIGLYFETWHIEMCLNELVRLVSNQSICFLWIKARKLLFAVSSFLIKCRLVHTVFKHCV